MGRTLRETLEGYLINILLQKQRTFDRIFVCCLLSELMKIVDVIKQVSYLIGSRMILAEILVLPLF